MPHLVELLLADDLVENFKGWICQCSTGILILMCSETCGQRPLKMCLKQLVGRHPQREAYDQNRVIFTNVCIAGAKMMYFLDPSSQQKAIAMATQLSDDVTGISSLVCSFFNEPRTLYSLRYRAVH